MDEQITSPAVTGSSNAEQGAAQTAADIRTHKPVAPYWHTALMIVVMVSVAVLSAKTFALRGQNPAGPFGQYISTMVWLWLLAALAYLGIRRDGVTIRKVVGGNWSSFDNFLIDLAVAGGFWIVSLVALSALKLPFVHFKDANVGSLQEQAKFIAPLVPHTPRELITWVFLAITAGLCEEFVFRGYLQRQFSALTRSAAFGIALSAIVFGLGHLYQGVLQMCFIGVYGAMFGTLAYYRKNLRPGMMAHAWQDTITMLLLSFLLPHAK